MDKRITFALCLAFAAVSGCGDDDGKTSPDGSTLPDGGSRPDGGGLGDAGPGMDGGGMDAMPPGPDGSMGNPDGGGGGGQASALIGPAGGTLTSSDGRLTLTIPQGALSRPTEIKITAATMAPTGGVGRAYEIAPSHEVIDSQNRGRLPTVTLTYSSADLQGGSPADLQLGRFVYGGWAQLAETNANPTTMKVVGTLPKFGTVGLFTGFCKACDPPPAPSTSCNPATPACRFNISDFDPDGEEGKCVAYGSGCGRCVPTCDQDNDGYCPGADDYNDNDPHVHRGAPELCNGIDDNCNGHTDEGCKACTSDAECTFNRESCLDGFCEVCEKQCETTCMVGFGATAMPGRCHTFGKDCSVCVYTCDLDGDGYCPTENTTTGQRGGDCDEANAAANPGKLEICGNNIDDNCNSFVDDGCQECSKDMDCPRADNYCLGGVCLGCKTDACTLGMACTIPPGAPNGAGMTGTCKSLGKGCTTCVQTCDFDGDGYCATQECDDGDPKVFPGAPEICGDTKDNNCNNHVDEGCFACTTNDQCLSRPNARGQEVCNQATGACDACLGRTCTFPDASMCGNFVVFDPTMMAKGVTAKCVERGNGCGECVPTCDMDGDGRCPDTIMGDGGINFAEVPEENKGDCDDMNPAIHKGAAEICGNDIDDDCDGRADEDCDACTMGSMCGTAETCSNSR